MKKISLFIAVIVVTFFINLTFSEAFDSNIVGTWSRVKQAPRENENSPVEKSEVQIEIYKKKSTYEGKIFKLIPNSGALCIRCKGDKKLKPLRGMIIIQGIKKRSDNEYSDGKFLDVDQGKEYDCRLTLVNPEKLQVLINDGSRWTLIMDDLKRIK